MAIRRCPYCKAIIDEGAEYCTNCGTKLLFPEDELIEEEIPGEKIFDPDFRAETPSPSKKRKPRKKKSGDPDEEAEPPLPLTKKGEELFAQSRELLDEEMSDETEKPFDTTIFPPQEKEGETGRSQDFDEDKDFFTVDAPLPIEGNAEESDIDEESETGIGFETGDEEPEVIPFEEESLPGDGPEPDGKMAVDEDIAEEEPVELIEDLTEKDQTPEDRSGGEESGAAEVSFEQEMESEPPGEGVLPVESSPETVTDGPDSDYEMGTAEMKDGVGEEPEPEDEERDAAAVEQDIDFKTADLENIVDPAEKEKEDIERFLDALKKERGGIDTPQDTAMEPQEENPPVDEPWEPLEGEDEEIPAWAENIQEKSLLEEGPLPFEGVAGEDEPERPREIEEEERMEEESPVIEEPEKEEKPPATMGLPEGVDQKHLPFGALLQAEQDASASPAPGKTSFSGLVTWMKARIFDVLFIAFLWGISVWAASLVVGAPLLKLISTATLAVILYYMVLLLIYCFLFFYFLGETIGDQLFAKAD